MSAVESMLILLGVSAVIDRLMCMIKYLEGGPK